MPSRTAPDDPDRESGAPTSGLPPDPARPGPPLRIFTRPWFWVLVLGFFWVTPLWKSLGAEYPDPLPGFDRQPEAFRLLDDGGREVALSDLAGFLVVVQVLDMSEPGTTERDFVRYRERRSRLRGLGSSVVQVVLVRGAEPGFLADFIDRKTARRPNNLFLLDPDGSALRALQGAAEAPGSQLFLLDRHARLRGFYGTDAVETDRFAQEMALLANWIGSDPELGAPVRR